MGRLILVEENVHSYIQNFFQNSDPVLGLIIGQSTSEKDLIVHLAQCPQQDDSDEEDAEDKKKKKKKKSVVDSIDEIWVSQHAKQVTRALPGGLDILGIFALAPPEIMKSWQNKLRQILFYMYKILFRVPLASVDLPVTDRILLYICSATRKLTCKTFDVKDEQSFAKPAEWKFSSPICNWVRLDCRLAFSLHVTVHRDRSTQPLLKQLQIGLAPFCKKIWNATCTINNYLKDSEKLIDDNSTDSYKKGGKKPVDTIKLYNLELYLSQRSLDDLDESRVDNCGVIMLIRGTIQGRAFVHSQVTVGEALHAMKTDIVRSIVSRCEIHCEDLLLIEQEQFDSEVVHELPRRVFVNLPNTSISVSDYLFEGDTAHDSLETFSDLLDLKVHEEDVEANCEKIPDPEDLKKPEVNLIDPIVEFARIQTLKKAKSLLMPFLGVVFGMAALGISYFYFD